MRFEFILKFNWTVFVFCIWGKAPYELYCKWCSSYWLCRLVLDRGLEDGSEGQFGCNF